MRARTLKHVSEFFDNALWKSAPFFLISGPNVVESEAHLLHTARSVYAITTEIGLPLLFKSSFDKANRTTRGAFRGIGIDKGLEALQCVKDALHVPIVTDIHEPVKAIATSQTFPSRSLFQHRYIHVYFFPLSPTTGSLCVCVCMCVYRDGSSGRQTSCPK